MQNNLKRGMAFFLLVGSLIYVGHGLHSGGNGPALPSLINTAHADGMMLDKSNDGMMWTVSSDGKTIYKWLLIRRGTDSSGLDRWENVWQPVESMSVDDPKQIHFIQTGTTDKLDNRPATVREEDNAEQAKRNAAAATIPGLGSAGQNKIEGVIPPRAGEASGATAPGSKPFPTPGKPQRNQLPNAVPPKGKTTTGGSSSSTK